MLWEELSWTQHEEMAKKGAAVIMPFAAIEQHGPHSPVVVDTCLGETLEERRAGRTFEVIQTSPSAS